MNGGIVMKNQNIIEDHNKEIYQVNKELTIITNYCEVNGQTKKPKN